MSETWIQGKYCHAEYLPHLECWVVRNDTTHPVIFVDTKAEAQAAVPVLPYVNPDTLRYELESSTF